MPVLISLFRFPRPSPCVNTPGGAVLAREREMLGARLLSGLLGLLSGASAYHAHAPGTSRHAHPSMWSGSPGLGGHDIYGFEEAVLPPLARFVLGAGAGSSSARVSDAMHALVGNRLVEHQRGEFTAAQAAGSSHVTSTATSASQVRKARLVRALDEDATVARIFAIIRAALKPAQAHARPSQPFFGRLRNSRNR